MITKHCRPICGAPGDRWINRTATNNIICTGALGVSRSSEVRAVWHCSHIWSWEVPRSIGRRSNDLWQDVMKWWTKRRSIHVWRMGWESTNVTGNWNGSGTGPVARSHHRANRTRSGTVPLRSHREVVGSFRNDRTQWNRCEHGRPVAFRNRSGPKHVVWTRPMTQKYSLVSERLSPNGHSQPPGMGNGIMSGRQHFRNYLHEVILGTSIGSKLMLITLARNNCERYYVVGHWNCVVTLQTISYQQHFRFTLMTL